MTVTPAPRHIRQIVASTFIDFGAPIDGPGDVHETLLVQDGRYFARSYRSDGLMAMWFVENGFIQFYDEEGNMLCTVNLCEEMVEHRMAA